MHGNVWEWCWDRYNAAYPEGSASDYYGPADGTFRVLQGGAWDAHAFSCRSASRHSNDPAGRYPSHGFRLVRTLEAAAVDFNYDGVTDILWRNDASGTLSAWTMSALGLTDTLFLGGIGSTDWKVTGVADFDGDAKNDILWRNDTSGKLSLWFMDESGVKGTDFVGGISDPDWQVAGIGDFDRDGRSDVFWRRLSTGDMSVWFVNERGYAGNMSPGSVDPSWLTLNHVVFAGGM